MSDDLVKRLRELSGEMADRIEADRAAMMMAVEALESLTDAYWGTVEDPAQEKALAAGNSALEVLRKRMI